jgi:type I restriction enzyme, R subunit
LSKTIELAHKSTGIEQIKKDLPIIEFDQNYLAELEDEVKDRKQIAANIVFSLNKLVLSDRNTDPVVEGVLCPTADRKLD